MAIKTVVVEAKPVVRSCRMTPVKSVSNSQFISLQKGINSHLTQNEARRAAGVEAAGQFMAK